MQFKEIIVVYAYNHIKHINKNANLSPVTEREIYSYHYDSDN